MMAQNKLLDLFNQLQKQMASNKEQIDCGIDTLKFAIDQLKYDFVQHRQTCNRQFAQLNKQIEVHEPKVNMKVCKSQTEIDQTEPTCPANAQVCELEPNDNRIITVSFELSSIPDECIRLIFRSFSVQKLISLRIVCHQWKSVIESMCELVRDLKLVDRPKKINAQNDNQLVLNSHCKLKKPTRFVAKLFANVEYVEMHFGGSSFQRFVFKCLEYWTKIDKLTNLKINIGVDGEYDFTPIWLEASKLSKLKSLQLGKGSVNFEDMAESNIQFVRHCCHLQVKSSNHNSIRMLKKIGKHLRYLELEEKGVYQLEQFTELSNLFLSKTKAMSQLTYLNLNFGRTDRIRDQVEGQLKLLKVICNNCKSLKELAAGFTNEIPINETLTELSCLPNLAKLHLHLCSTNLNYNLPKVQFTNLECLVLNVRSILSKKDNASLELVQATERKRLAKLFKYIPTMFPKLKQLKLVGQNKDGQSIIDSCMEDHKLARFLNKFGY